MTDSKKWVPLNSIFNGFGLNVVNRHLMSKIMIDYNFCNNVNLISDHIDFMIKKISWEFFKTYFNHLFFLFQFNFRFFLNRWKFFLKYVLLLNIFIFKRICLPQICLTLCVTLDRQVETDNRFWCKSVGKGFDFNGKTNENFLEQSNI